MAKELKKGGKLIDEQKATLSNKNKKKQLFLYWLGSGSNFYFSQQEGICLLYLTNISKAILKV